MLRIFKIFKMFKIFKRFFLSFFNVQISNIVSSEPNSDNGQYIITNLANKTISE